jgi:hypothetical protein
VERAGWDRDDAELHFEQWAPFFEVTDAARFVAGEAARLAPRYPKVPVAALMYDVASGALSQVAEDEVAAASPATAHRSSARRPSRRRRAPPRRPRS